jgi:hypothetical protein
MDSILINELNNLNEENKIKEEKEIFSNIIRLLEAEYTIFLTNKFFGWLNYSLRNFFNKYNIVYFNYNDKKNILLLIDKLNNNIKNSNNKKSILGKTKLKLIYFLENNIEPNTLYKKIIFSNEQIFLSFDNYIIKKREYKLRTFCQIAEKLGASNINIKSDTKSNIKSSINIKIDAGTQNAGLNTLNNQLNNEYINLNFSYNNFHHNLNLNKFYIIDLIEEESEFFISKEEFNTDIDLKFLIDARCLNLIESYDTKIIINRINELERKIFIKALKYGLNICTSYSKSDYSSVNIKIKFINIYNHCDCIIGSNLHSHKEGFWHLANIIKKETNNLKLDNKDIKDNKNIKNKDNKDLDKIHKIYGKINNYLKSHLISYDNKKFNINSSKNKTNNSNEKTIDIYKHVIKLNFNDSEINELFYEFFKDNLTFNNFKTFRNILLFGEDKFIPNLFSSNDIINKFYFISMQYNKIINSNNIILSNIDTYIEEAFIDIPEFINYDNKIIRKYKKKILPKIIKEIINYNKDLLFKTIKDAYKDSYIEMYGISDYLYSSIYNDANTIVKYDYDNKFNKILNHLNNNIKLDDSISYSEDIENKPIKSNKINFAAHDILNNILEILLIKVKNSIYDNYYINNAGYIKKLIYNLLIKDFINQKDNIISNKSNKINEEENNKEIKLNITRSNIIIYEENQYIDKIFNGIDINNCISIYHENKIFFTWNDYINIKEYAENNINFLFDFNKTNNIDNTKLKYNTSKKYKTKLNVESCINYNQNLNRNTNRTTINNQFGLKFIKSIGNNVVKILRRNISQGDILQDNNLNDLNKLNELNDLNKIIPEDIENIISDNSIQETDI